jgi:hypothetical protein
MNPTITSDIGMGGTPPAAAGQPAPFRGSYAGTIAVDGNGASSFSGAGQAAQLGPSTSQGHIVYTTAPASLAGDIPHDDFETLTFADGDSFTIVSHDVACPIGPKQYDCSGNWEVVAGSGTGRLTGVTGQGTFDGHSDYDQGVFNMELTGTLSVP